MTTDATPERAYYLAQGLKTKLELIARATQEAAELQAELDRILKEKAVREPWEIYEWADYPGLDLAINASENHFKILANGEDVTPFVQANIFTRAKNDASRIVGNETNPPYYLRVI